MKSKHIVKGILSGITAFTLVLGLTPWMNLTVKADAPVVAVSTWSALYDALQTGGNYKLTADVTYGEGGGDHASDNLEIPVSNTGSITLDLNGYTIDRKTQGYNFNYAIGFEYSGEASLATLTIKDSSPAGSGTITRGYYGIYANGNCTLNLQGGKITDCKSSGVYINSGCSFTMSGGEISGNTGAMCYGGVYVGSSYGIGGSDDVSTFNMLGGKISGNRRGVCSSGVFTMSGGEISGNTISDNGAGVYVDGGTFEMTGGKITGNQGSSNGGGVYVNFEKSFTMSGGEITGNSVSSSGYGGGVYANRAQDVHLSGKIKITDNNMRDTNLPNDYFAYSGTSGVTEIGELDPESRIGLWIYSRSGNDYIPTKIIGNYDSEHANWNNFFLNGRTPEDTMLAIYDGAIVFAPPGVKNVKFDTDGGNIIDPQFFFVQGNFGASANVSYDATKIQTTLTEPTEPTKPGYSFTGWTKDGAAFDGFGQPVSESFTLTAGWEAIPATAPTISTQPGNKELAYGYTSGNVLSVNATTTNPHVLSYQWYKNTTASNEGGEAITGATTKDYTIPTGKNVGTTEYYYCMVTATRSDNNESAQVKSSVATVTITAASASGGGSSSGGITGGSGSSGDSSSTGGGSTDKPSDSDKPADTTRPEVTVDVTKDPSEGKTPAGKEETSTVTGKDGSTTETTKVNNTDGSTTEKEKVTAANGTVSEKTTVTEKDGTVKTKETVENTNGSKTETATEVKSNGDFETKTVTTTASGKTKEVVETKSTDEAGVVTETKDTVKTNGASTEETKVTQPDGDYKSEIVQKDAKGEVTKTVTETRSTSEKTGDVTIKQETVNSNGATEESKVVTTSEGTVKKASVTETSSSGKTATVELKTDKNGDVVVKNIDSTKSTVTIPDAVVDADGNAHDVKAITAKALSGESKVKTLVVSKNVEVFEKNALKDSGVKTLELNKVPKFEKNSLNTGSKLTIVVHTKAQAKAVQKQLKRAGAPNAKVKVVKKK